MGTQESTSGRRRATSPRLAALPVEHLLAELAVFPIVSHASFRLGISTLDPKLRKDRTGDLWRAAEVDLVNHFPSLSLDEAIAWRDKLWFEKPGGTRVELHEYIGRLANQLLVLNGSFATPNNPWQPGGNEPNAQAAIGADARRLWRWISFSIPADLIVAALPGASTVPPTLELTAPDLRRSLRDHGFAELHLHLGASANFSELWVALLRNLPQVSADDFKSPGADFDEGSVFAAWLIRAALARQVLAQWLLVGGRSTFDKYLNDVAVPAVSRQQGRAQGTRLLRAIAELETGLVRGNAVKFVPLRDLYAWTIRRAGRSFPVEPEYIPYADPIARFFPPAGPNSFPEHSFVQAALRRLAGGTDRSFARLFWQVVRMRSLFYRHVVQRPMTPGLLWFVRFYARMSPAKRKMSDELLLRCAAQSSGAKDGLRALEVRTSPDENWSNIKIQVSKLNAAAKGIRRRAAGGGARGSDRASLDSREKDGIEIGLIYHFTRDRGGNSTIGRPGGHGQDQHGDPARFGCRYADFYREKRKEARALGRLLLAFPHTLQFVRGIDVCTDELGIPTWVLAPLLRYVRDCGRQAAAMIHGAGHHSGFAPVPPLRTTVHAGEDFVHLLGGLRRLDDAVRFFKLTEGDRVGHALALGIDPHDWARRSGAVAIPLEERFLDLLWECTYYSRKELAPPSGRAMFLRREVERLGQRLFNVQSSAGEWEREFDTLFEENALRRYGFPDDLQPLARRDDSNLRSYLHSAALYRRGRELVVVDPSFEGETLDRLQRSLRAEIARAQICVEANPSSNLLIGNYDDLNGHPLWRLRPPIPGDLAPIPLTIGSDDPLTFATGLQQEYQLVSDVLTDLVECDPAPWINELREASLRFRFTIPRSCARIPQTVGFAVGVRPPP